MTGSAQELRPPQTEHLREVMEMKSEATSKALELQARIYEVQLAALAADIDTAKAQISRMVGISVGVGMVVGGLATLLGLTIGAIGLVLAFRR